MERGMKAYPLEDHHRRHPPPATTYSSERGNDAAVNRCRRSPTSATTWCSPPRPRLPVTARIDSLGTYSSIGIQSFIVRTVAEASTTWRPQPGRILPARQHGVLALRPTTATFAWKFHAINDILDEHPLPACDPV